MRVEKRRGDGLLLGAAAAAALPCLFLPIYNPDVFWHLSAAKRMLETGAIPTSDWLSNTMAGAPWSDFEWLSELIYLAAHNCAGLLGLWLLKILLVAAAAGVFWAQLSLYRLPAAFKAAGLAAWAAAFLPHSDIRPDLFSVLGFALLFLSLEARRLGRPAPGPLWLVPFFALWANLHAGYAYGLALIGFYWLGESLEGFPVFRPEKLKARHPESLGPAMAAALVGSCLQPAGPGAYRILWRHYLDMDTIGSRLLEWSAARPDNPWHWPFWILLFLSFGAALAQLKRNRRLAFAPLAALVFCGVSASQHIRLGAFFAILALPLALNWIQQSKLLAEKSASVLAPAALIAVCAAYGFWWSLPFGLARMTFRPAFVPLESAEFVAREKALSGLKLYHHQWSWGGYLGWRLYPRFRVFDDGRYLFHPLLLEIKQATSSPKAWERFLERYGAQIVMLENVPLRYPMTRLYPDGSSKAFLRPYYILFMPAERWALVHWDDRALVFALRSAVAAHWLAEQEYHYARPWDEEALSEVLGRGEIPRPQLDAELERHEREKQALEAEARNFL